jgi:small Trp-rich protein
MYMVILGTLLLLLKVLQLGPTSEWPWYVVLAPFVLAVVWWAWADTSGWTKRRAMDKMDEKKRNRRAGNLSALGLGPRGRRSDSSHRGFRDVQASKIEDKRDAIRRKNKETLARSTRPASLDPARPDEGDSRH